MKEINVEEPALLEENPNLKVVDVREGSMKVQSKNPLLPLSKIRYMEISL